MKKSIIRFLSLLAAACLLFAIAGCVTAGQGETQSLNPDDLGNTMPNIASSTQDGKSSFIYNDENASWLKSGNLKVTVGGARLIENRSDIPSEGTFLPEARIILWELFSDPHNEETYYISSSYYYPDCFDSGGKFIGDGFLALVDVTFENIDGVGYIKDDWGPDAGGVSDDPYTFNASMLLRLAYLGEPKVDGPLYKNWDIAYVDGPMDFRIEPGESISMTVGFLVGNARDGGPVDRTQLELCYKAIEDRFIGLLEFENG